MVPRESEGSWALVVDAPVTVAATEYGPPGRDEVSTSYPSAHVDGVAVHLTVAADVSNSALQAVVSALVPLGASSTAVETECAAFDVLSKAAQASVQPPMTAAMTNAASRRRPRALARGNALIPPLRLTTVEPAD